MILDNKKYTDCLETLQEQFKMFVIESTAGIKNQAAALRSRKLSMEIRENLKSFRTISVTNDRLIREKRADERE
jgi:mannitol-1-phosphate/altronate dehydrogenase